jgi:hypothetical protein
MPARAIVARSARMKRSLLISLFLSIIACREHVEPAVSTPATPPSATTTPTPPPTAPAPTAPVVSGAKLMPVDEATSDPSLVVYRDELLTSVRERNADKVVALVDPKIRTSFGGGGGTGDFRRMLSKPGLWDDLEQLLSLGGTFRGEGEGRSFWAPYVYSAWPESRDAFTDLAVIGSEVPLRESSDANAKVIATLDHNLVTRAAGDRVNVKTEDGRTGWVDPKQLRSPIGYRAGFMKSGGRWRMNALVAGD